MVRKPAWFRFDGRVFSWFVLILGLEVLIAMFVDDAWIRPVVGDLLAMVLICCFLHSLTLIRFQTIVIGTFIFACVVEGLQFLDLIGFLGLRHSLAAHLIIGSTFDWRDILAYALGCGLVWVGRPWFQSRRHHGRSPVNRRQ